MNWGETSRSQILKIEGKKRTVTRAFPRASCDLWTLWKRYKRKWRFSVELGPISSDREKQSTPLSVSLRHPRKPLYLVLISTLFVSLPWAQCSHCAPVTCLFYNGGTSFWLLLFPFPSDTHRPDLRDKPAGLKRHSFHSRVPHIPFITFVPSSLKWMTLPPSASMAEISSGTLSPSLYTDWVSSLCVRRNKSVHHSFCAIWFLSEDQQVRGRVFSVGVGWFECGPGFRGRSLRSIAADSAQYL